MNEIQIKKAEKEDLKAILALQKCCYRENAERYNDYNIPPMTQTAEEIEREAAESVILKAEKGSFIAGSIRAYEAKGTCYIGRVIVHPDYQNRGLGTRLMKTIESHFSGVLRYELFTGYRDEKNLYFYGKLGYSPFKEEFLGEDLKLIFLEKTVKR